MQWYQENADVQQLLPILSVYMGHTYLAATSVYLTMTTEIFPHCICSIYHLSTYFSRRASKCPKAVDNPFTTTPYGRNKFYRRRFCQQPRVDKYKLGTWVSGQRYRYKMNKLSNERITLLEQIPSWLWNEKENRWAYSYDLLIKFYQREGHARVPFNHVEDDFNLGAWVLTQRKSYKAGKIENVRIAKLESLNKWSWGTKKHVAGH